MYRSKLCFTFSNFIVFMECYEFSASVLCAKKSELDSVALRGVRKRVSSLETQGFVFCAVDTTPGARMRSFRE